MVEYRVAGQQEEVEREEGEDPEGEEEYTGVGEEGVDTEEANNYSKYKLKMVRFNGTVDQISVIAFAHFRKHISSTAT